MPISILFWKLSEDRNFFYTLITLHNNRLHVSELWLKASMQFAALMGFQCFLSENWHLPTSPTMIETLLHTATLDQMEKRTSMPHWKLFVSLTELPLKDIKLTSSEILMSLTKKSRILELTNNANLCTKNIKLTEVETQLAPCGRALYKQNKAESSRQLASCLRKNNTTHRRMSLHLRSNGSKIFAFTQSYPWK